MKKKLLNLLLAFCFVLPAIWMFSGCGAKCNISVSADSTPFVEIFEQNTTGYDNVKKGNIVTYDIVMPSYYDRATLKVYANGQEIEFTPNDDDFTSNGITYETRLISSNPNIVGNFSIKIEEDTEFKLTAEEQNITVSTRISQGEYAGNLFREYMLKDFVVEAYNKSFYDMLTTPIQVPYSQLTNGLNVKTSQFVGYYNSYFITDANGFNFLEVAKKDSKEYTLFLRQDENVLIDTDIEINADGLTKGAPARVLNETGAITNCSYENVFTNDCTPFTIDLSKLSETVRNSAELIINGMNLGNIVNPTNDRIKKATNSEHSYYYELLHTEFPINYYSETEYFYNQTADFKIGVKLNITGAEPYLCKLKITNNCSIIETFEVNNNDGNSVYYIDHAVTTNGFEKTGVTYIYNSIQTNYGSTFLLQFKVDYNTVQDITFKVNEEVVKINASDVVVAPAVLGEVDNQIIYVPDNNRYVFDAHYDKDNPTLSGDYKLAYVYASIVFGEVDNVEITIS